jgi:ketose-bisphosphate aldolase
MEIWMGRKSKVTDALHKRGSSDLMQRALQCKTAIPAFNIPYLPMMEPVVRALHDTRCFGQIAVARLEWIKFESGGPQAIYEEYERVKDLDFTRLHLDHVPVIDEDDLHVDYTADISAALALGYDSVMIDGSRLSLEQNIEATKSIVELAHARDVPVEAELGAVLGHEAGPLPPYEELFSSGKGFTDLDEACRFVNETGVDWLSVAVGSIHGAISPAKRTAKKIEARLSIERIAALSENLRIPLVLHGGSGIRKADVLAAVENGIAKINVATAIRQPYEALLDDSMEKAIQGVYDATVHVIEEDLELSGSADIIYPMTQEENTL